MGHKLSIEDDALKNSRCEVSRDNLYLFDPLCFSFGNKNAHKNTNEATHDFHIIRGLFTSAICSIYKMYFSKGVIFNNRLMDE